VLGHALLITFVALALAVALVLIGFIRSRAMGWLAAGTSGLVVVERRRGIRERTVACAGPSEESPLMAYAQALVVLTHCGRGGCHQASVLGRAAEPGDGRGRIDEDVIGGLPLATVQAP
jgi:hypothetical protein